MTLTMQLSTFNFQLSTLVATLSLSCKDSMRDTGDGILNKVGGKAVSQKEERSHDGSLHVTDEHINVYTHLAAAVLSVLGLAHLVVSAGMAGKPWHVVAFSIYGFSLFFLFLCSVLHHGINGSLRTNEYLRVLDYVAIYLLIAGSVTPVTLVLIRGAFGWTIFGVSWAIALTGVVLKLIHPGHRKGISNTLYLTAGWITVTTALPVYRACGVGGLALLALGGVVYSAGAVVFAIEKPNPFPGRFGFHEIWHLFVMLAAAIHYAFMLFYVLPVE
jgi:hemolysin III